MKSFSLLFLIIFSISMMPFAFAQKYHSANDGDVEFSLEEKSQGPKPFYIDKEAIEKARRAQYASEKKEAKWLAKKLTAFLKKIDEQKIAQQIRAANERVRIAEQSMKNLPTDVQQMIAAQNQQARAVLERAKAQQNVFDQSIKNTPKGTEISRALASFDTPAKILKHQPKRINAKKLWAKMGKILARKSEQAAIARRAKTKTFVMAGPSALPLGLQKSKVLQFNRKPASISSSKENGGLWQGVTQKISGAIKKIKTQFFNW